MLRSPPFQPFVYESSPGHAEPLHSASSGEDAVANGATAERLHRELAGLHAERLSPRSTAGDFDAELEHGSSIRRIERAFVEAERARVWASAHAAPRDGGDFMRWFESMTNASAERTAELYDWLAEGATHEQLSRFVDQDLAGEMGFDSLTPLLELPLLELPLQGVEHCMQRAMLGRRARSEWQGVDRDLGSIVWESLAVGNLMVALAAERHYAYQSLGARSALEQLTPWQAERVSSGLRRVGIGGAVLRYYEFNSNTDHARVWTRGVLAPLVEGMSEHAVLLAEGVLLRLDAGARVAERLHTLLPGAVATFEFAESVRFGRREPATAEQAPSARSSAESSATPSAADEGAADARTADEGMADQSATAADVSEAPNDSREPVLRRVHWPAVSVRQ